MTERRSGGSLLVVGTGIQMPNQLTVEARAAIETADRVFYGVADPITRHQIKQLHPQAESLFDLYSVDKSRTITYREMVEKVLAAVRAGFKVCFVLYGHPGVFAQPSHAAIRQARSEGFPAKMLPAISAEDCLIADLGVDPGAQGCQSFEAWDFLLRRRKIDSTVPLLLWQVAGIGERNYPTQCNRANLALLTEYLQQFYPSTHEIIIYEASPFAVCDPKIERLPLSRLAEAPVSSISTVYIPAHGSTPIDAEMAQRSGWSHGPGSRREASDPFVSERNVVKQ